MTCPVCPCPTCVAARQYYQPLYQTPFYDNDLYQCGSCKGWYTHGTAHLCMTPLGSQPTMGASGACGFTAPSGPTIR